MIVRCRLASTLQMLTEQKKERQSMNLQFFEFLHTITNCQGTKIVRRCYLYSKLSKVMGSCLIFIFLFFFRFIELIELQQLRILYSHSSRPPAISTVTSSNENFLWQHLNLIEQNRLVFLSSELNINNSIRIPAITAVFGKIVKVVFYCSQNVQQKMKKISNQTSLYQGQAIVLQ